MRSSANLSAATGRGSFPAVLSLFVPGAGQIYLRHRERGGLILGAAVILAYLINWALTAFQTSQIVLGGLTTSWLWFALALFWAWNVYDAYQLGHSQMSSAWLGVLFAAVILYVIGWSVTDVKLERLVTRFNDARLVAADLVHPDILTHDEATGALRFSENFQDIIGRVQHIPAPGWMRSLGLAAPDATWPTFVGGTLIQTIAIGLLATLFSTVLALPLSFLAAHNVMSRVPGGTAIYYAMRTFLNVVRAVDPVIWGLIVLVWVGLGSFAGTIALTIHSVAALGKLYSEEIEHIDPGPVEAVTATGANLLQVLRFAVVPQIVPPFLAYTLLRWDINMRAATIVGFTAGGGIGYFVVETIRLNAFQQYAAALWPVAVVIILVDYISASWRARILEEAPGAEAVRVTMGRRVRNVVYAILGVALFVYCFQVTGIDLRELFQPAPTFLRLVRDFLSIDLTPDVFSRVSREILITIFQALLATTFGGVIAIPFSFLAAKNLVGRSRLLGWLYYLTRSLFNIFRSIEALLYVAIFIAWVGIGSFAGTLALAVTSFALLGKLFSEAIENIELGPMEAVTATGANRLQVIMYAILPQIIPPFASYWIYQWDINIRMATIIGFAGGGGIGLMLQTFFGSLQYHKAGTVVAFIVLVVALMDFASARLREKLV
jgi:phosphonate ABC transporter permease subunit PhnE